MIRKVIAARPTLSGPLVVLAGLLGASLIWASWTILGEMAEKWSTDTRYAHGYLVPVFSLVLLWLRRDRLAGTSPGPSWWGIPLIGSGLALQLAGAYFYFSWLEAVSLLPSCAGLCVVLGGWRSLRWSWPSVGFLAFMLPLPYRVEVGLAGPLQRVATLASTHAMRMIGLPALAEGNVIHLDNVDIGVVEACSGLSMLFTFFAMSVGVAIVVRRPLLDKVIVIASAIPIALFTNVVRITVTGVLHEMVSSRIANVVFHDLAGWLMMPMALGLLWAELGLLSLLLVEPGPAVPRRIDLGTAAGPTPAPAERAPERRRDVSALKRSLRNS